MGLFSDPPRRCAVHAFLPPLLQSSSSAYVMSLEGVVAGKTIEWRRRIGSSTTGLTEITDNGNTIQIVTTNPNQPETISVLTVTETTPGDYCYHCRVDIPETALMMLMKMCILSMSLVSESSLFQSL